MLTVTTDGQLLERISLDPEETPVLEYMPGAYYVVQTQNEHLQLQVQMT